MDEKISVTLTKSEWLVICKFGTEAVASWHNKAIEAIKSDDCFGAQIWLNNSNYAAKLTEKLLDIVSPDS